MKNEPHLIKAKVWLWEGDIPWHFATIEKEQAEEIKKDYTWPRRGFGSIPINVTIGKTSWKTSIFPDKNSTYVLPIKKEVRNKEGITVGKTVEIELEVIV